LGIEFLQKGSVGVEQFRFLDLAKIDFGG
jgi:hypothetical protein